jgi:hypothetical protein
VDLKLLVFFIPLYLLNINALGQLHGAEQFNRGQIEFDFISEKISKSNIKSRTSITNTDGNTITDSNQIELFFTTYNSSGQLSTQSNPGHSDLPSLVNKFNDKGQMIASQNYYAHDSIQEPSTSREYEYDEFGRCSKMVQINGNGRYVDQISYDKYGYEVNLLDSTKITVPNTIYDSQGRKDCVFTCYDPEYECDTNQIYIYRNDTIIQVSLFNYKPVHLEKIFVDNNGVVRYLEQTQYNYSKKKMIIEHKDKWVKDEFGNVIEYQYYDRKPKSGNRHDFYIHTTDKNGNVLKSIVNNEKGKKIQEWIYTYAYY